MSGLTNEAPFVFRQFEVKHHLCAHKVGFDGVLLGAWTHFAGAKNILDIGTGCGLIALMAAQQNAEAQVTAIENHSPSADQAKQNFIASPWSARLQLTEADFLHYPFSASFDRVVTNPPFYLNRPGANGQARTSARHLSDEALDAFMQKTATCLAPGGSLSMILPWREWSGFKTTQLNAGYWTKRECLVYTRDPQTPERVLLECCLEKCEKQSSGLNIYDAAGKYSQEYIKLTGQFYLNL